MFEILTNLKLTMSLVFEQLAQGNYPVSINQIQSEEYIREVDIININLRINNSRTAWERSVKTLLANRFYTAFA